MPELEVPEASAYPSARLRLIVRFDDPSRKRFNRRPAKIPMSGMRYSYPKALDTVKDGNAIVLVPKGSKDLDAGPQQQGVSRDLLTQVIDGVIPRSAVLSLNGIRTASTLSLEIPYADLPIEPRMIRGAAVEFFLGTITTASEWGRGIAGETRVQQARSKKGGIVVPLNVIPDEYVDGMGRTRTNLRFQGWVDDLRVTWGENAPMVKLECRDNTTLLIDTEAPQMLSINPSVPIDQAFADYLARFPQFAGLRVEYRPASVTPPTYSKVLAKTAFRPRQGPAPVQFGGSGQSMSVWDYFTDIAGATGHIVRFDGTAVVVQLPRTIYGQKYTPRDDDPFRPRTLPSGLTLPFRTFIYGRNVIDVNFGRKFSIAGPTTIEVRSYSTAEKRTVVVRYPLKKDRLERGLPGMILPDEKIVQFHVDGIKDQPTLLIVAQQIYEQLGRNELEVTTHTRDLWSYGGSALDPDLLDCKPGDTILFQVTDDDETSEMNNVADSARAGREAAKAADYVRRLGYSDEFAQAYGQAKALVWHQPNFRVRRIEFNWDLDQGIDVVVSAINYLEVRGDELPEGDPPATAQAVEAQSVTAAMLRGGGRS